MPGKQARGRCTGCGEDRALTASGVIWAHTNWVARGDCPGSRRPPMTTEEAKAWDEKAARDRAARDAEWQRQRDAEAMNRIERGGFRTFDEDSLRACYWQSPQVAFIAFNETGPLSFTNNEREKAALLKSDYGILIAWPGEWRQDIFRLDGPDKDAVRRTWLPGET